MLTFRGERVRSEIVTGTSPEELADKINSYDDIYDLQYSTTEDGYGNLEYSALILIVVK